MRTLEGPGRATTAAVIVLAAGCAVGPGSAGPRSGGQGPAALMSDGIEAMEERDYREASGRLYRVTARCESGDRGRRALLLLAALALDPRNPDGSPDHAAWLTARALTLPEREPGEHLIAETLFLLALERGARVPVDGSDGPDRDGWPPVAARIRDCRGGEPAGTIRSAALPALPGASTALLYSQVRAERDALQSRVAELEAELARIRELLNGTAPPDSSGGP